MSSILPQLLETQQHGSWGQSWGIIAYSVDIPKFRLNLLVAISTNRNSSYSHLTCIQDLLCIGIVLGARDSTATKTQSPPAIHCLSRKMLKAKWDKDNGIFCEIVKTVPYPDREYWNILCLECPFLPFLNWLMLTV